MTLADWICFILHSLVVLIVLDYLKTNNYLSGWYEYAKCGELCVKSSIFDTFFDFEFYLTMNRNVGTMSRKVEGGGLRVEM